MNKNLRFSALFAMIGFAVLLNLVSPASADSVVNGSLNVIDEAYEMALNSEASTPNDMKNEEWVKKVSRSVPEVEISKAEEDMVRETARVGLADLVGGTSSPILPAPDPRTDPSAILD